MGRKNSGQTGKQVHFNKYAKGSQVLAQASKSPLADKEPDLEGLLRLISHPSERGRSSKSKIPSATAKPESILPPAFQQSGSSSQSLSKKPAQIARGLNLQKLLEDLKAPETSQLALAQFRNRLDDLLGQTLESLMFPDRNCAILKAPGKELAELFRFYERLVGTNVLGLTDLRKTKLAMDKFPVHSLIHVSARNALYVYRNSSSSEERTVFSKIEKEISASAASTVQLTNSPPKQNLYRATTEQISPEPTQDQRVEIRKKLRSLMTTRGLVPGRESEAWYCLQRYDELFTNLGITEDDKNFLGLLARDENLGKVSTKAKEMLDSRGISYEQESSEKSSYGDDSLSARFHQMEWYDSFVGGGRIF